MGDLLNFELEKSRIGINKLKNKKVFSQEDRLLLMNYITILSRYNINVAERIAFFKEKGVL